MQKQRRLNQNLEEHESDSDSKDDYDEFQNNSKTDDVIRNEEEDQIQDSKPTTWHRYQHERNKRIKLRFNKKSNMKIEITI